jgi:hypothetical protein
MRRRIVWLVVGVLAWAGIAAVVYRSLPSDNVPIRVGMSAADIYTQMESQWSQEASFIPTEIGYDQVYCERKPRQFYSVLRVHFDKDDRLIGWDKEVQLLLLRDRWDRAKRGISW